MLFGFIDIEIASTFLLAGAIALLVICSLQGAVASRSEDPTVRDRRSPGSGGEVGGSASNDGCAGGSCGGGDGGGGD